MSKITDKLIFDLIKQHYRPYDAHREFAQGFAAYQAGPHETDSISAQAWDLGWRLRCTIGERPREPETIASCHRRARHSNFQPLSRRHPAATSPFLLFE